MNRASAATYIIATVPIVMCALLSSCYVDNLRDMQMPEARNYCLSDHAAGPASKSCIDDYFRQLDLEGQKNRADIALCSKQFSDGNKVWWCVQNRREARWERDRPPLVRY